VGAESSSQDERYLQAATDYGPALGRLARGYEADADLRRDLEQEIHVALWRSFAGYDGRCSVRTWVYRVAHNVGASHVIRRKRARASVLVGLEALADAPDGENPEQATADRQALTRLTALIQTLNPPDRQVILLYLEDLDAAAIGEITGLTPGAAAVKIHRIKAILARRFQQGGGA